ncbi:MULTISPECIES: EscU/YscU/HrcU family type III secretion system export apparatus switch protein [Actinosynnema]|uniref:EscU/YscU/HrcU family type III secretion system export apparatus switch protein n=1 Tax=Actinosynnema TaxID=40566 RepID=UPI0020A2ED74|nr:EscU/YscU/HrcU family type III secretion system export apparatus switch protein [Actinosynnema pretiosum]MCP2099510.1 flagellar biosynthetic protein FlhB [Actinosynnema pretiosum]
MSGKNKDATEEPTAKKIRDAKREGRIARTPDLGTWLGILGATWTLPMTLTSLLDIGQGLLKKAAAFMAAPEPALAVAMVKDGVLDGAIAVLPLSLTIIVATLVAAGLQGTLRMSTKQFKPKFTQLNPLKGIKNMFGPHSLWEALKTLIKTALLAALLYVSVSGLVPSVVASGSLSLASLTQVATGTAMSLLRLAAIGGLVMAVVDYAVAKRRIHKELKMTKQEVKDEHKQSEGDPQLKGAIRSKQMQMSRNRMMAEVPNADVVLVNPTHIAVALRYDPARGAPRVVAKGAGAIATKIRELATEHRVPIVQDVPLARALHKACEVGHEIPFEMFGPVAQVLAFLHRLKRKGSAAGTHRMQAHAA